MENLCSFSYSPPTQRTGQPKGLSLILKTEAKKALNAFAFSSSVFVK